MIWRTHAQRVAKAREITSEGIRWHMDMLGVTATALARSRQTAGQTSTTAEEAKQRLRDLQPHALRMHSWSDHFRVQSSPLKVAMRPYTGGSDHGLAYVKARHVVVYYTEDDERNLCAFLHELAHIVEGDRDKANNALTDGHGPLFCRLWLGAICEALMSDWAPLTLTVDEIGQVEGDMNAANETLKQRAGG